MKLRIPLRRIGAMGRTKPRAESYLAFHLK
jgi:hypothetical protein